MSKHTVESMRVNKEDVGEMLRELVRAVTQDKVANALIGAEREDGSMELFCMHCLVQAFIRGDSEPTACAESKPEDHMNNVHGDEAKLKAERHSMIETIQAWKQLDRLKAANRLN